MGPIERPASLFATPPVLGSVAVLMTVALLHAQSALAVLCAASLCVAGGAKLWSVWSLARVRAALRVERQRVFPDERLHVQVSVSNAKWLPVWLQVRVPLTAALGGPASRELQADTGLSAQQRVSFRFELRALSRGVHALGPCLLSASDPLGLFPRQRLEHELAEVIVYPRLVPLAPLALPRRDNFGRPGAHSPVIDPAFIHGVRDYQPGSPARYIHWKASARQGRLLEKVCEPGERERVLLLVAADGFQPEPFERCLEVVASWVVELLRRGSAVGLLSNARLHGGGAAALAISGHPGHAARVLEALARLQPVAADSMLALLPRARVLTSGTTALAFGHELPLHGAEVRAYCEQRRVPLVHVECAEMPPRGVAAALSLRALCAETGAAHD
jgi:uncharacterized protein (DUF58 family)